MRIVEIEFSITWIQTNPDLYRAFFAEFMDKHKQAYKISSEVVNDSRLFVIAQYKD